MLNDNVLVLNAQWLPVGVSTVRKTVTKMFRGHCKYIDMYLKPLVYDIRDARDFLRDHLDREPSAADIAAHLNADLEAVDDVFDELDPSYTEHALTSMDDGLKSWLELEPRESQSYIRCKRYKVVTPEVVKFDSYKKMPRMKVRFSRQNVLIRDEGRCQYCGVKVVRRNGTEDKIKKLQEYTWDHVIPKSRGGLHRWENIVVACMKCNNKKSDRTMEECGMHLVEMPVEPNWNIALMRNLDKRPRSWDFFLDKTTTKDRVLDQEKIEA